MEVGAVEEVVGKAEFARMIGVDRSAISHYVKNGKLNGDALVGEGRKQKICVAAAMRQLDVTLDPLQRAINGRADIDGAHGAPAPPPPEGQSPEVVRASPSAPRNDPQVDKLREGRIREQELKNARAEREARLAEGVYVRADDVAQAVGSGVAALLRQIEAKFPQWAEDVAEKISAAPGKSVDLRMIETTLSAGWAAIREAVVKDMQAAMTSMPESVSEPLFDADPSQEPAPTDRAESDAGGVRANEHGSTLL